MKQIQEYKIPKGATLDVCFSPEGAWDAGIDAITPKGYAVGTGGQFAEARTAEWKASGRTDGPLNANTCKLRRLFTNKSIEMIKFQPPTSAHSH